MISACLWNSSNKQNLLFFVVTQKKSFQYCYLSEYWTIIHNFSVFSSCVLRVSHVIVQWCLSLTVVIVVLSNMSNFVFYLSQLPRFMKKRCCDSQFHSVYMQQMFFCNLNSSSTFSHFYWGLDDIMKLLLWLTE